ncbi:hypothetical protein PPROV_000986800 [Pycnococcus provasolii]|uniref:Uncharacterized protein n=1 Tax=Pycnococcus provasolii TaxID=41880 RepID=A0A830HW11_9CHLO|nr:hypothetical protein PPROV_000986800 [Pycnococcus provasolii]
MYATHVQATLIIYLDSQALVQAITKDGPHGLMKHEAKWIVRARESVTRGIIEPRLIPRHENLADPGTTTRGPTDFIPMRDATLSSHQHALTTQEIAHREAYPHVREARANIASRRAAAAATQHQQQQQQQQQQRVTTIPPPEWKIRPDPGTRDTSESNKERWDVPEYTPPTADFTPARGILQNHNSGLPPSRRDDATARPPSAAQTATQQATRERAQQPAGL